jgi:hypothetical protein
MAMSCQFLAPAALTHERALSTYCIVDDDSVTQNVWDKDKLDD